MLNSEATRAAGPLLYGWARRTIHGKKSTPRQLEALVRYLPIADQVTYLALGGIKALEWAQSALDQHVDTPVQTDTGIQVLGLPYGGPNGGRDNEGQFFSPNTDFMDGVLDSPPVMYIHGTQNGFEPEPVGMVNGRWYDRKGGWFNVELDTLNPRYQQLMDAHVTGNLRASSGAVPASYSANETTGHIDTWLVGELSLVDIREGYRPINGYAITKAASDVHFEDYYGDLVEEKPMGILQRLREQLNEMMLLLARDEVLDDGKCAPDENERMNRDVSYIDPIKAEEKTLSAPAVHETKPPKPPKAEEVQMDDVIPAVTERCIPCEEAAVLAAQVKAELLLAETPAVKCARCPEAVQWVRSMVKAGKMSAVKAFGYLDEFTKSDETFEALKAEIEAAPVISVPIKAEQVFIAGGQATTGSQDTIDPAHMAKQRRLAGLPTVGV